MDKFKVGDVLITDDEDLSVYGVVKCLIITEITDTDYKYDVVFIDGRITPWTFSKSNLENESWYVETKLHKAMR